jgi:hypothetical protein
MPYTYLQLLNYFSHPYNKNRCYISVRKPPPTTLAPTTTPSLPSTSATHSGLQLKCGSGVKIAESKELGGQKTRKEKKKKRIKKKEKKMVGDIGGRDGQGLVAFNARTRKGRRVLVFKTLRPSVPSASLRRAGKGAGGFLHGKSCALSLLFLSSLLAIAFSAIGRRMGRLYGGEYTDCCTDLWMQDLEDVIYADSGRRL